MPRGRPPTGRRTKMCRLPEDVIKMLGGLARAQGVSIPDIGDTVIRDLIQRRLAKLSPAERQRLLTVKKQPLSQPA